MYFGNEAHPPGGKMTTAMEELVVGDTVELKGPLGSFVHLGNGLVRWRNIERKVKNVGLVCGGTGERLSLGLAIVGLKCRNR